MSTHPDDLTMWDSDGGGPYCPGCGWHVVTIVAMQDLGRGPGCDCPGPDRRFYAPTRAVARELIARALDLHERAGHPHMCQCLACEMARQLGSDITRTVEEVTG